MTDEKWEQLVEQVQKTCEDVQLYTEDLLNENAEGLNKQGTQDILEFSTSNNRFRIVRENRPVLLDKKMHYSHRQGQSARTEYVFSDKEFSHKVLFFKEDPSGEWQKMDSENLNIF